MHDTFNSRDTPDCHPCRPRAGQRRGPAYGSPRTLNAGAGAQTDPHLSGSRVSYTNRTTTGSLSSTSRPAWTESRVRGPDVSGLHVGHLGERRGVHAARNNHEHADDFLRGSRTLTPTELAPLFAGTPRTMAAIGSDTVAFPQSTTPCQNVSAVCIASLSRPADPTHSPHGRNADRTPLPQ